MSGWGLFAAIAAGVVAFGYMLRSYLAGWKDIKALQMEIERSNAEVLSTMESIRWQLRAQEEALRDQRANSGRLTNGRAEGRS